MLASALPVEGELFTLQVEQYLTTIKAMSNQNKIALKMAYMFSRKVPCQEREDLFQDIALAIFKSKTKEEKLAYTIARCDWKNWWAKYKVCQHYSLDTVIEDEEGDPRTLAEMLVGETEFEFKMDGKIDAQRIWDKLPAHVQPIILERLIGKGLNSSKRNILNRWLNKEGYKLLLA